MVKKKKSITKMSDVEPRSVIRKRVDKPKKYKVDVVRLIRPRGIPADADLLEVLAPDIDRLKAAGYEMYGVKTTRAGPYQVVMGKKYMEERPFDMASMLGALDEIDDDPRSAAVPSPRSASPRADPFDMSGMLGELGEIGHITREAGFDLGDILAELDVIEKGMGRGKRSNSKRKPKRKSKGKSKKKSKGTRKKRMSRKGRR
jgi:hypothetical protein